MRYDLHLVLENLNISCSYYYYCYYYLDLWKNYFWFDNYIQITGTVDWEVSICSVPYQAGIGFL